MSVWHAQICKQGWVDGDMCTEIQTEMEENTSKDRSYSDVVEGYIEDDAFSVRVTFSLIFKSLWAAFEARDKPIFRPLFNCP